MFQVGHNVQQKGQVKLTNIAALIDNTPIFDFRNIWKVAGLFMSMRVYYTYAVGKNQTGRVLQPFCIELP